MKLKNIDSICYISSSRADYYIMEHLLKKISLQKKINVNIAMTGAHCNVQKGNTVERIKKIKSIKYNYIKISYPKNYSSKENILNISTEIIKKLSKFLLKKKPKVILLLGDRSEIFLSAYCATILQIPIVHFHGGELSSGAYDESFRHSISKMSYWHFVATKNSKKRLIQLGENKRNIFNIGSLVSQNLKLINYRSVEDVEKKYDIKIKKNFAMMTYYPTTLNPDKDIKIVDNIIEVLKKRKIFTIISGSNIDSNSLDINKFIKMKIHKHKNFIFINSLGAKNYLSLMKQTSFLIGNSSSGIIEAPICFKPSITVGDRQKNRERTKLVFESDGSIKSINACILKALKKTNKIYSPYYKANSIDLCIKNLLKIKLPHNLVKNFYNLK
jgi:GDP/UDP-N,N'-diacetylbacillosamine 2-epimerase (hydrolysing)